MSIFPSALLVKKYHSPQNTFFCHTQSGLSRWTVASAEAQTWRRSHPWPKYWARMLTHKYQLLICRGKLQHTALDVFFFFFKHVVQCPTLGCNGRLYSGSISVGVEVHGRHHSGEGGFVGLRNQSKWVESSQIHRLLHRLCLWCIHRITPTLRVSCPRNSDTIAILMALQQRQSCQHYTVKKSSHSTASSHVYCVFDH